jgi:hypothetical protein
MMSKGESICPVALLDPTEAVWLNNLDSSKYLQTYAKLNRLPYGFVICDAKKALDMDFKAVVVSGFALDENKKQAFKEKGIVVLDDTQLDELNKIVNCDIRFSGEGTPHFVRKLIDGEEFVFIANVENESNVRGTVRAYGKEKEIDLPNVEVVYISANCDNIEEYKKGEFVFNIPEEADVEFADENIIPLERFENAQGEAVLKTAKDDTLSFAFESKCGLDSIKLYIPKNTVKADVCFNSTFVKQPDEVKVYDEDYLVYTLKNVREGQNTVEIKKDGTFEWYDRIFIKGDFDAEVTVGDVAEKKAFAVYNISLVIPEKATVVLSERSKKLLVNKSWAEQNQPFYSGWVKYSFKAEFNKALYRLVLPQVRDVVKVHINGKKVGERIKTPYIFEFDAQEGVNEITIDVANSLGNAFECYKEASGILAGGYVEKI